MVHDSKAILEEINELYDNQNYDDVIKKAQSLINDENVDIASEAKLRSALSYFRKGEYKDSMLLFEDLALLKNDVLSWYNVTQSAILSNEIQKGKDAFNKALELQRLSEFNQYPRVPKMRYDYAGALCIVGLFNEAVEQLNELKKIYMKLEITDDNFLFLRGVPFFSHTLDLANKVFTGLGMISSLSDWLEELKQHVDDNGKRMIDRYQNMG